MSHPQDARNILGRIDAIQVAHIDGTRTRTPAELESMNEMKGMLTYLGGKATHDRLDHQSVMKAMGKVIALEKPPPTTDEVVREALIGALTGILAGASKQLVGNLKKSSEARRDWEEK